MVWGEELIRTWVSRSSLQSCLPLAIFFVCTVAIMVLKSPCCGHEVYTVQGLTAVGDLVTDVIVRVTSSICILVVKW